MIKMKLAHSRARRHFAACFLSALLCPWAVTMTFAQEERGPKEVNTVRTIRAVKSTIEIELHSSSEFPVRAEIPVLRIGTMEFSKSRNPDDGRLDTLIFVLTPEEFDALPDGGEMTVGYGRRQDAGRKWNFGKLNKALLRR